ncbi:hypothetical protein WICPIJ_004353 [Wickerhamomyces pijperi]|uniref:Uncharacterized protein n=1 Tax=Wickerhamomyces pijperi TaxID=599730 RepID=A0A9P8TNC8_WICPI|nr:hypothetical protein WICPIJ_004353 [Wickerhamomyces pijperi]
MWMITISSSLEGWKNRCLMLENKMSILESCFKGDWYLNPFSWIESEPGTLLVSGAGLTKMLSNLLKRPGLASINLACSTTSANCFLSFSRLTDSFFKSEICLKTSFICSVSLDLKVTVLTNSLSGSSSYGISSFLAVFPPSPGELKFNLKYVYSPSSFLDPFLYELMWKGTGLPCIGNMMVWALLSTWIFKSLTKDGICVSRMYESYFLKMTFLSFGSMDFVSEKRNKPSLCLFSWSSFWICFWRCSSLSSWFLVSVLSLDLRILELAALVATEPSLLTSSKSKTSFLTVSVSSLK